MSALNQRIMESLTRYPEQTQQLIHDYANYCKDTGDFQSGYELALAIQNLGFIEPALLLTELLYTAYPDDALLLLKAELLIDQNQLDEAIEQIMNIEETSDYYISALLVLADAYQQLELYEVALEKLKIAKRLAFDEPVIDLALYELYFYMGENKHAYDALVRIENDDVIDQTVYIKKLARVLAAMGEYEEAIYSLEQLSREEHDSESLFELGLAYYQKEEHARAYATFNDLLSQDPDFHSAYYYFGKSAIDSGLVEEGIQHLEEALQHNPYHETLYITLFEIYQQNNARDKIGQIIQLAKDNQVDGLAWMLLVSRDLLHQEAYEEVIDKIRAYLEVDDEESELYWILATAYAALEDDDNAQVWYEKSYVLFGEDVTFLKEYALYMREIGRRDTFHSLLTQIKQIDPREVEEFGDDF